METDTPACPEFEHDSRICGIDYDAGHVRWTMFCVRCQAFEDFYVEVANFDDLWQMLTKKGSPDVENENWLDDGWLEGLDEDLTTDKVLQAELAADKLLDLPN